MIERFLTAKRAEGSSVNTIRSYRADLADFQNILNGEPITRHTLRGFLQSLAQRKVSKVSASHKLAVVKSLCRWLAMIGELPSSEAQGISRIRKPKIPVKLPNIPSAQDVARLLDGEFKTAFPKRDRLILELLYSCGLRVSEAAGIKLEDIRQADRHILIHGKGGKSRLVPIGCQLGKALDAYIPAREQELSRLKGQTPYLLFGWRGRIKKSVSQRITTRSIARILAAICKARGLRRMNPHLLRHACATHMLDNGAQIEVIAQLLGHSRLETAARYAQVSTTLMMSQYSAAHPHAQTTQNGY